MDEAIIGALTAAGYSCSCAKCGAPACWATSGDPSSFRCSACDLAEEPMRGQPEMAPPETHVAYIAKLEEMLAAHVAFGAKLEALIAAKDETIRRLANERAALQSLVDEVRFPDAGHAVRYVEMSDDEFSFPVVAMKEGGWRDATWADWSDDEESV